MLNAECRMGIVIPCESWAEYHVGMGRYFTGGFFALLWVMVGGALGADVRGDFLRMIDRPRVPLAVEISKLPTTQPVGSLVFRLRVMRWLGCRGF